MAAPGRHTGVYSIGVVKNLTGLTERQIRYYEEQGLVAPRRTAGGQRLYSPADVERLLRIKLLLHRGKTLEEVRRALETEDALDQRWIAELSAYGMLAREGRQRLRHLPALLGLVRFRRHRPPAIDRLYRGVAPLLAAVAGRPVRLYPLDDPATAFAFRTWLRSARGRSPGREPG